MKEEVYLFGGSFNPFHLSHQAIVNSLLLDGRRVIVLPTQNPWKQNEFLDISSRIEVLEQLYKNNKNVVIADSGLRHIYMVDILREIEEKFPKLSITVVLGSDSFERISEWKDWDLMKTQIKTKVFKRGDDSELIEISSTEIRKDWSDAKRKLDPIVYEYIHNKLFS